MGSADVLRLLLEIEFDETQEAIYLATCTIDGCEWGTLSAHCFLENGAVECLEYACRNSYDLTAHAPLMCVHAVLMNRPRCLKFAHEHLRRVSAVHARTGLRVGHCYLHGRNEEQIVCRWYVTSRGCPCPAFSGQVALVGLYSAM